MALKFNEVNARTRDPEKVRAKYEAYFSKVRSCIEKTLARKPQDLFHALRLIHAELAGIRPPKRRFRLFRRLSAIIVSGRPQPLNREPGANEILHRMMTADLVMNATDASTRRIVELGSGWGANLFFLRAKLPSPETEFVACEYTAAGREVTRMLGAIDPRMRLSVLAFDYLKPDLSGLAEPLPTVVFSNHSIEQITKLGHAVFDELLALPGLQRVVHIEPVSWQLAENTRLGFDKLLSKLLPPTMSWREDFRRRAKRHAYNTDLIPVLRELERKNMIVIESILPDHVGTNPHNPGTAIIWRPANRPK